MPPSQQDRFGKIIEPHLGALYRAAYRLHRNRIDSEDLVQDVCVRAFDKFDQLIAADAPRAWLLRVQYNLFVDTARRNARLPMESLDAEERSANVELAAGAGPVAEAVAEQLTDRLACAWHSLTKDQQALLSLRTEGYTLAEIAEIADVPMSALKARLHRARVRLGKLLDTHSHRLRLAANTGEAI